MAISISRWWFIIPAVAVGILIGILIAKLAWAASDAAIVESSATSSACCWTPAPGTLESATAQQPVVPAAAPAVPISSPSSFQGASNQPVTQPVQQVPQNVQKNAVTAAPMVVKYQVTWTEVTNGFDPSTIPVEEGLYDGTMDTTYEYVPGDPNSFPQSAGYAWKILPQLEGERADWNKNILVAAARDQVKRDTVLVSISADGNPPYILLSVDGEKSWYMLNLLWEGVPYGDATRVRVTLTGNEVHVYGKDSRPGNHWWTAPINKTRANSLARN